MTISIPEAHRFLITTGTILKFNKYPYEDGGEPTDKIMIVLHCDISKDVLTTFTFTTSNFKANNIPSLYLEHELCSCDLLNPIGVDFFYFQKNKIVGDDKFAFDKSTFVLFQGNIRERRISFFKNFTIGSLESDIYRLATLNGPVMIKLLNCILQSDHITIGQEINLKNSLSEFLS